MTDVERHRAASGGDRGRDGRASRGASANPLAGLAPAFFEETSKLIATPWAAAAIPDFVHPDTRGERPADFEQTLKFGIALGKLAARDPAVHKLTAEVQHLLKPRSVYQDPELVQRVFAVMRSKRRVRLTTGFG